MSSTVRAVHGELLIMRLLMSETIPDNVTATQNALGLLTRFLTIRHIFMH